MQIDQIRRDNTWGRGGMFQGVSHAIAYCTNLLLLLLLIIILFKFIY